MTQKKLVLKDQSVIENGSASRMNNQLLVSVPGNDLANAFATFSDAQKTETIEAYYSVYKKTFHGFTELFSVQYFEDQNEVHVWLKGENISEESEYTVPEEYLPESMRTKKVESNE